MMMVAATRLTSSPIVLPPEPPGSEPGQLFVLQDYRWVPVIVRQTPTAVDCSFAVVTGSPTVHAELISEREFARFLRHHDYDALAETQTGIAGGFHHVIDTPGRYLVLVMTDPRVQPPKVSLVVRTTVDPASISTGVSPQRRWIVILASLTLFIGTVSWSGRKLLVAYRNRA